MKLSTAAIVLSASYLQASATPKASASTQTCDYPTVPFYRAWSATANDYFYTTNTTELDAFTASGYTSEGVGARILPSDTQAPTAVPLFRLYTALYNQHYYTAEAAERDQLVASSGLCVTQEVAGQVYGDQECGTVPFYRLWKGPSALNFFTTFQTEVSYFENQLGYTLVGVQAYVFTP